MNTTAIVEILNKEFDANISTEYYTKIEGWRDWWKGHVKAVHTYQETTADGSKKTRELYTMKMAKKVCEDWAGFLLNEKTKITVANVPSSEWLQGADGTGGVFGAINFWQEANGLVEKAFYSGTGAFVLRLDGIMHGENGNALKSPEATVNMEYLPAMCLFPLTVRYGQVTEVAFASERTVRGKDFVYLEMHTLEPGGYVIRNRYYRDDNGALTEASLPDGVVSEFSTGSPYPLFSIIKPATVNNQDPGNNGLGISIYANAIDQLKAVDKAFTNFVRDVDLGAKKVFYNRELTKVVAGKDGQPVYIAPDDMMQQLFISVGDSFGDEGKNLVQEFNPDLRVQDNRDAVQAHLDYLSSNCGMGSRQYRFDGTGVKPTTATQYAGERQDLKQHAAKHSEVINKALQDIVRAILWAGNNLLGQPVDPETEIKVEFSDGYIVSDEERKADDRQDLLNGVLLPYEYRMRQYGEDEETAKAVLAAGRGGMTFGGNSFGERENE